MALITYNDEDYPFLPYPAISGCTKSFAWLTEVFESNNGTEKRASLRGTPRINFQYSIPYSTFARDIKNTVWRNIRAEWAVADWTQAYRIGTVSAGGSSISFATTNYDYQVGGMALICSICGKWEVLTISGVNATSVTFVTTILNDYRQAFICPVYLGRIAENASFDFNGYNGVLDLDFIVTTASDFPVVSFPVYLDREIHDGHPLFTSTSGISKTVIKRDDTTDFDIGKVVINSATRYARVAWDYRAVLQGPAEIKTFVSWLYHVAGRMREFWLPTFESDIQMIKTGSLVEYSIDCYDDNFAEFTYNRRVVGLKIRNQGFRIANIDSIQRRGDNRLTLVFTNEEPPINVNDADIEYISFYNVVRLDTDAVEFDYLGNNVVETTFRILEIKPNDYTDIFGILLQSEAGYDFITEDRDNYVAESDQ